RITWFVALLDLIVSTEPGQGGIDTIATGGGADTIVGGAQGDVINGGTGANLVLGDAALLDYGQGTGALWLAQTTDPGVGGDDTISLGTGNGIVLGGTGRDTMTIAGGTNIVLGDDGYVDYVVDDAAPADLDRIWATDSNDGAADTITIVGAGSNYVVGG